MDVQQKVVGNRQATNQYFQNNDVLNIKFTDRTPENTILNVHLSDTAKRTLVEPYLNQCIDLDKINQLLKASISSSAILPAEHM